MQQRNGGDFTARDPEPSVHIYGLLIGRLGVLSRVSATTIKPENVAQGHSFLIQQST